MLLAQVTGCALYYLIMSYLVIKPSLKEKLDAAEEVMKEYEKNKKEGKDDDDETAELIVIKL